MPPSSANCIFRGNVEPLASFAFNGSVYGVGAKASVQCTDLSHGKI